MKSKKILTPQGHVTKSEINSSEDANNTYNLMSRISNSVEHNNSLEQVTNKLGKSVRLISLGTGER